jgi:hypothetical protein
MPVQAHHCTSWTTSVTNEETVVLELPDDRALGVRYVVNDLCNVPKYDPDGDGIDLWFGHDFGQVPAPIAEPACIFSIFLYYEINGIPGLQRGDEVRDDSCHWMIESDYFVW